MRLLETFQEKIGFTRKEAIAVLALSSVFLAGGITRWLQSRSAEVDQPEVQFDYSLQDSIYAARSKRALEQGSPKNQTNEASLSDKTSQKQKSLIININTATKAQLVSLPGIGETYAERIIEYRGMNGKFTSVEDLQKVKGIGKKKMEKLRQHVTVR